MNDKTLYLHKLTNQRKRFEKWDIAEEYKKEYLDLIDKHIAIEREKSQDKKDNYAVENVLCALCGKVFSRTNIYVHHRVHKNKNQIVTKPIVIFHTLLLLIRINTNEKDPYCHFVVTLRKHRRSVSSKQTLI